MLYNAFFFIVLISIVVFIHELGHFLVARLCKVKVEQFSIGFGKEICGFFDKHKTRWKICMIPLGGYVKMYGHDQNIHDKLSAKEKEVSYLSKSVYQRIAIVLAGPLANFLLAIFIFILIFRIGGSTMVPASIGKIQEGSAAQEYGLKKGDLILNIDGDQIKDFDDIVNYIAIKKRDEYIFSIQRNDKIIDLKVKPQRKIVKNAFGEEHEMPVIGIMSDQPIFIKHNLLESLLKATQDTYKYSALILKVLKGLFIGDVSFKELGGPVKIAQYSGKSAELGIRPFLFFMALISINLGVINLIPIPGLDGGHLFFYLIEIAKRSPLSLKSQEIALRLGFGMLVTLMIFVIFNDIVSLIA